VTEEQDSDAHAAGAAGVSPTIQSKSGSPVTARPMKS
jgi:hypothetical protein